MRSYISHGRPRARAELDWFRQQPTLESAIEFAALAIDSRGKRYAHQRRLKKAALRRARQVLLEDLSKIEEVRSFESLFNKIEAKLGPIHGLGELYVYDTSLRIGARMGLLPDGVYLHAGTRDGARALGFDPQAKVLEPSVLPAELHELEPHEIEDLLCIYKGRLMMDPTRRTTAGILGRECR